MLGDFLGGLLVFASIVKALEITFSVDGSPKKRRNK